MAGVFGQLRGFDFFYSSTFTDSFYTAFPQNEVSMNQYALQASNYFYLFASQRAGTVPIYRYYSGGDQNHFYTKSSSTPSGYISEGIIGYAWPSSGSSRIAVYRFYNPTLTDHRYTTSGSAPGGYNPEGIEWYSPIVVNGCSDPTASNYNPDVNQASSGCTYPPPTASFSASPTTFCRNSTSTLSWSVSGLVSSVSINQGIGTVATSGTRTVSPTSTTTYTLTATGTGGTTTRTVTLTVLQPSDVVLTLDNSAIIRGQSTTLRWTTTGDTNSASITPGIGSVNINGNRVISPTETTTYQIYVDGICVDDTASITLTVYQPPTVDLSGPESLNYGQQGTLTYQSTDADISLQVSVSYAYKNGIVSGNNVNLPTGVTSNGTITTTIPYNDFGPFAATYVITAIGNGGQESKQILVPINVDETPANFLVPESEDLLKSQNPIYTPDSLVTSYEILIDDIDIPVEIKADRPILVDINDQEVWTQIRQI
jgi:hypothetical protein